MELIETPVKMGKTKDIKNKVVDNHLDDINTSRIFWHLIKRHKFGIVLTWAIIITVAYLFPPFWSVLGSVFS